MGLYEIFIELEDQWFSIGTFKADSGEEAIEVVRKNVRILQKWYSKDNLPFVNLDFEELK